MKQYIISIAILLVLDFLWIGFFMKNKYNKQIPQIQKSPMKVNFLYAVIAYILMAVGLVIFVIPNIRPEKRLTDSLYYGFLFGFVLYGVYDFTNGAIFKNWDFKLAYIDVLWGGLVYFLAAYVSKFIVRKR